MLKTLRTAWDAGKSCVIDSTNPSTEKRLEYIDKCLSTTDIHIRVLWHIRDGRPFNELRMPEHRVGTIVYNMYTKHFEHPELDAKFLKGYDKNRITYEISVIY